MMRTLQSVARDKISLFQARLFEDFVALITQVMNILTMQFTGKLMPKIVDLKLFTVSVLISTGVAECLKEKVPRYMKNTGKIRL